MTYEVLKSKLERPGYLKKDAYRWIDQLPLSTTPEQVQELKDLVEKNGVDILPEDGEARLEQVESQSFYTAMMTDTLMEV